MDRDELETLQEWATGGSRAARRAAGQDLQRRKAGGALSRPALHLIGLLTGPGHRWRRKRFGRRLAFSFLFLIVTGPARRQAAGWGDGRYIA